MTYTYAAYGLGIHSTLPLPELLPMAGAGADVIIRQGETGHIREASERWGSYTRMAPMEAYFYWERAGSYLVRGGREILVESLAGVDEAVLRLPLVGVVLAAVLQQRGLVPLHGSAVAVDGEVAAFLGASGQGKSTMAATLYARGHTLVADDWVCVDVEDGARCPVPGARCPGADRGDSSLPGAGHRPPATGHRAPRVLPAFPQLKLLPDAAASLGDEPERLARVAGGFEKRARRAAERFARAPLPLRRLYLLEEGPMPEIASLPPSEALLQVLCQSYLNQIFDHAQHGAAAPGHFLRCARLAENVPVRRLKRPRALEALPAVARLVEADLQV